MSSAAKAKPVVLAVGVADADAAADDGNNIDAEGTARVGEGDAVRLGVTVVDPQAASSSEIATTTHAQVGARETRANRQLEMAARASWLTGTIITLIATLSVPRSSHYRPRWSA